MIINYRKIKKKGDSGGAIFINDTLNETDKNEFKMIAVGIVSYGIDIKCGTKIPS